MRHGLTRVGTTVGLVTDCGPSEPEQIYVDLVDGETHRPIQIEGWVGYGVDARMRVTHRQATELIGLLANAVGGVTYADLIALRSNDSAEADDMPFDVVCAALGISGAQSYALANMNDNQVPFPDIADKLEEWLA